MRNLKVMKHLKEHLIEVVADQRTADQKITTLDELGIIINGYTEL